MMTAEQLKASILQLAMQGKLVEQRPEEGTGEELYKEIQIDKKKLIKDGSIKAGKKYNAISEEEILFDIPDTWVWTRLSDIVFNRGQKKPENAFSYIDIGSIDNVHQRLNDEENIIEAENAPSRARKIVAVRDVIYSTVRPYLHNMCIIDREFSHEPIASTGFAAMTCHKGLYNRFLFYYLLSPDFDRYANDTENSKGVAYPAINDQKLYKALVPLPPLAEQKRIVSKIEELMPFVEQYAAASTKLNTLNASFPEMMKKSILQEAVQGKLVPQDSNDEPASLLLKKNEEEKKRLIKEGKIKKPKPLPEITEDEIPFDIPESWEWVRFENAVDMLSGFAFKSSDFVRDGEYRLLRGINLGVDEIRWDDTVYVNSIPDKLSIYQLKKGDVLLGLDRPWISNGIRVAVFDGLENTYLVQRVLRIREFGVLSCEYIALILKSSLLSDVVQGQTTGISVPHISPKQVGSIAVPVPPVEEQKRIVEKVKLLCTEIDSLRQ